MNFLELLSLPAIVSIVYSGLDIYKKLVKGKEKLIKIIPVIAGVSGIILGIIFFFAFPEAIPAGNVFMAILVGGASGLAATGTNQIFKQLLNPKEASEDSDEKNADGE